MDCDLSCVWYSNSQMDIKYECCDMNLHVAVIKPEFSLTQVTKVEVEDQKGADEQDAKHVERNIRRHEEDDGGGGGCELSLSLSLQYHNTSSTSETSSSEAFSSYLRSNYKH